MQILEMIFQRVLGNVPAHKTKRGKCSLVGRHEVPTRAIKLILRNDNPVFMSVGQGSLFDRALDLVITDE